VKRGATVAISGPIDLDDHWLPSAKFPTLSAQTTPIAESEAITIGAREFLLRYDGEKMQRLDKAVVQPSRLPVRPLTIDFDSGKFIWSTLPLELGDSMPALAAFYRLALSQARISPVFTAIPRTPAVLILPSIFRDVVLYTFVSETNRDTRMHVTHLESRTRFAVSVPAQRTAMVLLDRKNGQIIARL
jgi:hypothetical protein